MNLIHLKFSLLTLLTLISINTTATNLACKGIYSSKSLHDSFPIEKDVYGYTVSKLYENYNSMFIDLIENSDLVTYVKSQPGQKIKINSRNSLVFKKNKENIDTIYLINSKGEEIGSYSEKTVLEFSSLDPLLLQFVRLKRLSGEFSIGAVDSILAKSFEAKSAQQINIGNISFSNFKEARRAMNSYFDNVYFSMLDFPSLRKNMNSLAARVHKKSIFLGDKDYEVSMVSKSNLKLNGLSGKWLQVEDNNEGLYWVSVPDVDKTIEIRGFELDQKSSTPQKMKSTGIVSITNGVVVKSANFDSTNYRSVFALLLAFKKIGLIDRI